MSLGKPQQRASFKVAGFSRCFSRCRNMGTPKFWGAPLAHGHTHFSCGCDFMMGLGKPNLCNKFEVTSFSHRANIEGNLQISGSSPSPGPRPLFFCVWFYDGLWQTPAARQIWSHYSFSRCRNIIGNPQILGSSPSLRPRPLFLCVRFYDGPWQTQSMYQI